MRKIASLVAVSLVLAAALTGCAGTASKASGIQVPKNCTPLAESANTKQVAVKLVKNDIPKVNVPVPLKASVSTRSIVKQGKGLMFEGGQFAEFEYSAYNARTGALFQSSAWNGSNFAAQLLGKPDVKDASIFCQVFAGAREGATVAALLSAKDSHGGQAVAAAHIAANDAILFVFQLRKVFLPRAIGTSQPAQDGFPQVVLSNIGVPGLVMQDWSESSAPKEFKKETLIQGAGQTVKAGDNVTVHYSGFVWSPTKTKFDSSWDSGNPAQFKLDKGAVIPGFISALVGEKVGSQVVAVLPPSVAYGSQATGSIPANATLIFVIDILGVGR